MKNYLALSLLIAFSILGFVSGIVSISPAYASDVHIAAIVGSGLPMYDPEADSAPGSGGGGQKTLSTIIGTITSTVGSIIPILFSLVMIFFFYNFYQLIMNTGDAEKHKQARPRIMWSIIIMFVIFSVWGIIALFQNTLFGASGSGASFNPGGGPFGNNGQLFGQVNTRCGGGTDCPNGTVCQGNTCVSVTGGVGAGNGAGIDIFHYFFGGGQNVDPGFNVTLPDPNDPMPMGPPNRSGSGPMTI